MVGFLLLQNIQRALQAAGKAIPSHIDGILYSIFILYIVYMYYMYHARWLCAFGSLSSVTPWRVCRCRWSSCGRMASFMRQCDMSLLGYTNFHIYIYIC